MIALLLGGGALLVIALGFVTGACTVSFGVSTWDQSPGLATEAAEEFAQIAFVEGDAAASHGLLEPELANSMTLPDLEEILTRMHPDGTPAAVTVVQHQRLNNYRGLAVYLEGTSGTQTFHYRLLMAGSASDGYTVAGLWRTQGQRDGTEPAPRTRRLRGTVPLAAIPPSTQAAPAPAVQPATAATPH